MAQKAIVTSAEAIEAFRSSLVVYVSKARPTLEEVSADVQRMRQWLENDQRRHWENEIRKRTKVFEQAQQELFSARISSLQQQTSAQQLNYRRARYALDEANEKLRVIKRWIRDFDGQVQPLVKQMEKLHTFLSHDLLLAIAHLSQIVTTLAAYAERAPAPRPEPGAGAPPAEAAAPLAEGAGKALKP